MIRIATSMQRTTSARGLTIVELLVYVLIAALVLLAVVASVQSFYRFYRELTQGPRADRAGIAITDRIMRDIRTGVAINGDSIFNSATGALSIKAQDDNGAEVQKRIVYADGRLTYSENGGTAQDLTPADMHISRFQLWPINTPISQAVRFELEITYDTPQGTETRSFTGVAILRHSYE